MRPELARELASQDVDGAEGDLGTAEVDLVPAAVDVAKGVAATGAAEGEDDARSLPPMAPPPP